MRSTTAPALVFPQGLPARTTRPAADPANGQAAGEAPRGRLQMVPPAALTRLGVRARRLLRTDD
ncbi:hypothetical protein [Ramlibacter pinisoli]|uniref:hypothetical protein n=1 Tax=Ramlibacter sp. CGMCC 1.13660 TaxID=2755558 RepID=UPI001C681670|nr:hypothetical protein [Ramlibacter sp. CGMCC 1.13660]